MSVSPDASVVLASGTVAGKTLTNGVKEYLGVPYAEPLDRVSAFEEPKPLTMMRPEMHAGVKEMDEPYGGGIPELTLFLCPNCTCLVACSYCMRSKDESTDGKGKAGLDVLRMNIWSPPTADGKKPVIVWLHGGGDAGSARKSDPNSRSGHKLAQSQDVVVCCLEFRQGILGTMDWGSGSDVPTNLELRDMVCGLQWVQANIGAFGGDASCVTIVGESIGGRRVCELLWCPAAAGLFHRAIASSPSGIEACNLTEAHRAHRRSLVNAYLGLPTDATPSKAQLSALPRQKLANAQHAAKGSMKFLPLTKWSGATAEDRKRYGAVAQVPRTLDQMASAGLGFLGWRTVDGHRTLFDASSYDGTYMPQPLGEGAPASAVPLLLAFTKDEYSAFSLVSSGLRPAAIRTEADSVSRLAEILPMRGVLGTAAREQIAREYLADYQAKVLPPGAPISDVHVRAAQDVWQYHTVVTIARAHSAALPGQTYVAQYAFDAGKGQTPHGADVSTTFGIAGQFDAFPKGTFDGLAALTQAVYGAFARSGDPSTEAAPFTAYEASAPMMTRVDGPSDGPGGAGCTRVEAMGACDAIYAAMVAKLRAAEKTS